MLNTLIKSDFIFPKQNNVYKGKVRDVYYLEDNLVVMVASDRISAFDVVMPRGIPYKGQILNQIAVKMMNETNIINIEKNRKNILSPSHTGSYYSFS